MILAILMYHRVCARTAQTEPYFARGTAVEPDTFQAQITHLSKTYQIISLAQMVDQLDSPDSSPDRPQVVLTFDDGYVDCIDHVLPICARNKVPFSVFPIAMTRYFECPWVDAYYHMLGHSSRTTSLKAGALSPLFDEQAPAPQHDMQWWVRGPIKKALFALATSARWASLLHLSQRLHVHIDARHISRHLFCQPQNYRVLLHSGVELGGHGERHERLGTCTPEFIDADLQSTVNWLDELGCPDEHRVFCYPDGHYSQDVMKAVKTHGFAAALSVTPGLVQPSESRFALPRFIVRNMLPSTQNWCAISSHLNTTRRPHDLI